MFEAENIRDWREHDVIDPDGKKIGQLEAVYVDTTSDEPTFGSIRIGMVVRRRLTFVPLDRAVVLPGQLRVAYGGERAGGPADAARLIGVLSPFVGFGGIRWCCFCC